jgi:Na+/proline symporter/signal transduction histidine kinase/ActR/RegA family two-component response regulator
MIDGVALIGLAFAYVGALFLVAWVGDRLPASKAPAKGRPIVYALSIAVFCTSWTFFGSVGLAAAQGYDFLPVYVGAIVCFLFCQPLIQRIVRLAKNQNITSVADFLAARYGKSQPVAAVVAGISVVTVLPYIALQLKAVALSVDTMLSVSNLAGHTLPVDTAFIVAATLAVFAVLFGTRHADATEHQHGLMLAIAAESIVKLAAFLAVGAYIVMLALGDLSAGLGPALTKLLARAASNDRISTLFASGLNGSTWLTVSALSFIAVLLLPRQFHVVVVENTSEVEVRRAAWLFPAYLVLINLFVVPIAVAGLLILPQGAFSPDTFVLALPLWAGAPGITLLAFVGGLSAATAMVIVESVALAIMVCNGLVAPVLLRSGFGAADGQANMVGRLLAIRRVAILAIIALAYGFYRLLGGGYGLASIGLVSFAGIAQLAPAFFIGLWWRKGTARGAIAGMLAGIAVWAYTLVLPWFAEAGLIDARILTDGPWGLALLAPRALFYLHFDPLTHGVLWSLAANTFAYVTVSLLRLPEPVERLQANIFVADDATRPALPPAFKLWRTSITVSDLEATVGRYLGVERARRSFAEYAASRNAVLAPTTEADVHMIRFTEHVLTSAIGAASSRLVLSLLLQRGSVAPQAAMRLLDDASEALQYNRDLLQSALDQVRHGLSVFDKNMQLVCWNRQFRELLDLPPEMGRVGVPLDRILHLCAERGDFGAGRAEALVSDRLVKLAVRRETFVEYFRQGARILEIRTAPMPQGGIVTTYADITERMAAADALARANDTLERRVAARTTELSDANGALAAAKAQADAANQDKTRFLAAASHDILQPLNAARLYASSLVEHPASGSERHIAGKIDQSLNAVEEILGTLIEIARLDTSRMVAEITDVPVQEIFDRLRTEFEPLAHERGLTLHIIPSSLWIASDRRLLPRLMQNLVSNAIKYTASGRVVVGARRAGNAVTLQVWDTGPGIAADQKTLIFKEFQRLAATSASVHGLGLGLSIVERIAKVLDHRIEVVSRVGRGSMFSASMPRAVAGVRHAATAEARAALTAPLGRLCVLCIDNDAVIREGMRTLLSTWKCDVLTADSSCAAVEVLRKSARRPDVILADYHLDDETGVAAIAAVRAHAQRATPAIVITADGSLEVQRLLREAGHVYLRKPVKVAALRAALTQIDVRQRAHAAE